MSRDRKRGARAAAATGLAAAFLCAVAAFGAPAAAAAVVVTAGSQQITFSGTARNGVVGDANGYDTLAFNLESGQGGMGGDLQIGSGAGGATLSGNLEVVPPGDTLAAAPGSATVPATPGESLLVLDGAGNYVLVTIKSATSQTVWFTYVMQSSVSTVQAPAAPSQGTGGGGGTGSSGGQNASPSTNPSSNPSGGQSGPSATGSPPFQNPAPQPSPTQGSSGSGSQGVYALPGNCATVSDGNGNPVIKVVVNAVSMFSQQLDATEMMLDVGVAAPTDVTKVSVQQSGSIGGMPWTQPLYSFGQDSQGLWQFSMQQSDLHEPFQILITSPTLAADGIANPATGVTELDWTYDSTQGCGGTASGTAAGAQSPGQGSAAQAPSQPGQPSQAQPPQRPPQGTSSTVTVELQIGSPTATVDGQTEPLAVAAEIDAAGRTMVPFRFLGQALGATVSWDGASRTASYQLGSMDVAITIGQSTAVVNGRSVALDTPAVIVDGSTMVPVRFVSEALGATVGWDASTRTVTISYQPAAGQSGG